VEGALDRDQWLVFLHMGMKLSLGCCTIVTGYKITAADKEGL
jgi:hypothetical protein